MRAAMGGPGALLERLPELNSLPGALLAALLIYLFAVCLANLAGPPLARALTGDRGARARKV